MGWLKRAAGLPGRALAVGLVLWHKVGWQKCSCVPLCLSHGAELGIGRDATRRGLRALADAGLVTFCSQPGRCLEVTLLDAETG
jgi:hypothetical protein